MPSFDAIIIGGGHNGLVCAAYLGKAGKRCLVLEAADQVGGAARNSEIAPGFTVSACAHILHLLHPRVIADLDLARHGLVLAASDLPTVALAQDGPPLVLSSDAETTAEALRAHSAADAARYPDFSRQLARFAGALQPFLGKTPPRLAKDGWRNRLDLLSLGWQVRKLGRDDMREFLRVVAMNVFDLVEDEFESNLLKGALGFDAVLGTHLGPRSPNSVLTLLYRLAGEVEGRRGALALPRGGMGAVTQALRSAAETAGAEVRTGAPVQRIVVEGDRAKGVVLETGETIASACVVSNADPKRTFLDLLGAEHLDTGFVRRVGNIRMRGNAAKINLALDGLPDFPGLDINQQGGRLLIAPSLDYVEQAFNPAKYGEYSDEPTIEITLPSLTDPSLAPNGKHVLSAVAQYAPYRLKEGWDTARDSFADKVVARIADHAPDLPGKILARQVLTPLDLERDFRMTGGHWHHGELAIDQMFLLRPLPGATQYKTPLPGLYLCGAGAHPGGGVMGAAGMNAARQVLALETREQAA